MSGIAGIIRFDGQAVAPNDITALGHALQHRGSITSQSIATGVLLAFGGTLEADNTAAIYAATDADVFGGAGTNSSFSTNYRQNGPTSFNDVNADFAVALWDAHEQVLVCARDSLGVKPVYYVHQPGRFFAFATEIKALLALQEVPVTPNLHKFREYLTWPTDYVPYSAETFYETIYSVLPGHYLRVNAQDLSIQAYWKPDVDQYSKLGGAEAYTDLFAEYFTTAIDARMRGKARVGSHLSGGLDSSSVSCVAQHLLGQQNRSTLHTFTIDTGLASTDESAYVNAVVNQYHPVHHTVQPIADVLDSILKINALFDRPEQFIIPSSFHLSVSVEARQLGCDCILTGHDGDSVSTTGLDYLDQLLDDQDWENLRLACQQLVSFPDRNLQYVNDAWLSLGNQDKLEQYILYVIGAEVTRRFKTQPLSTFLSQTRTQTQRLGLSAASIVAYCVKRVRAKLARKNLIDNAFSADFKQRVPARTHLSTKALTTQIASDYHVPINPILNTTNVICNEQLNHIGAHYGHPYSFPFFDKQVVELALATPLGVCFDQGRGRGLIRNGLQNRLPPAIVSRLDKANFVEYANVAARQLYEATREEFASPSHAIWAVIDREVFSKIVATVFNPRIPVRKKTRYNWLLSRIIYLALWLSSLSGGKK